MHIGVSGGCVRFVILGSGFGLAGWLVGAVIDTSRYSRKTNTYLGIIPLMAIEVENILFYKIVGKHMCELIKKAQPNFPDGG